MDLTRSAIDHVITVLKNDIQNTMLHLNRQRAELRRFEGQDFKTEGPRPRARDCVYINYEPEETENIDGRIRINRYTHIEFEGQGPGGVAIAHILNTDDEIYCEMIDAYVKSLSEEAEAVAVDKGDWENDLERRRHPGNLADAKFTKGEK